MNETRDRVRPKVAIPSPVVVTRGERIRQARHLRRLSIKALAEELQIGERTLGRIERDELDDPRRIVIVEDFLGVTEDTPTRTQSPPLDQATNTELAFEVYRRLTAIDTGATIDQLPDEARTDPDRIAGPPAPETGQTGAAERQRQ